MAISVVGRKLLWGRAGNSCAWRDCGQRLTAIAGEEEAGILATQGLVIGEEAHIRSSKVGGPRYDSTYDDEKIDSYENLVLLCPTHHTIIDKDNGAGWPTSDVVRLKSDHEAEVDIAMSEVGRRRQQIAETVAAQISVWEIKLGIGGDEWIDLTFGLNMPTPIIRASRLSKLSDLGKWLLSRTWPGDVPKLQIAFDRHFLVIQRLISVLSGFEFVEWGESWRLDCPYNRLDWNPPVYERMLRDTNITRTAIWYLTCELNRSANLVIDAVRQEVDSLYRAEEGLLLASEGDGLIQNQVVRDVYRNWDWSSPPSMPSIDAIKAAVVAAARSDDHRIQDVDPRALEP